MFRFHSLGLVFALVAHVAEVAADETINLLVPRIQCARCIESLSGTLNGVDTSVNVTASLDTKKLEVTYDPAKVTAHQLMMAVSDAPPVHNQRYEAGLLITVEDPVKSAAKLKRAFGQVKGVINFMPVPGGTAESGDFVIFLRPIPLNAKPADHVKASQISDALEKGGLKFSGLPPGTARVAADEPDSKKKQGAARTSAKSKLGADDMPLEKSKPTRLAPTTPKGRPTRDNSLSKKEKDESDDRPRFVILAGDSDKVYLVDHEAKTAEGKELKKLVKQGDKFGEYVIKEVGDDEGLYVVLEHAKSKEITRVEHKKKDKERDGQQVKDTNDTKSKDQ